MRNKMTGITGMFFLALSISLINTACQHASFPQLPKAQAINDQPPTAEEILEKHLEDIQKYRRVLAKHLYSLGNFLCQNGKMTEGKAYLTRAMKAYPFNVKLLLAVFASLFGQSNYNNLVRLKRRIIPVK